MKSYLIESELYVWWHQNNSGVWMNKQSQLGWQSTLKNKGPKKGAVMSEEPIWASLKNLEVNSS